MAVLTPSFPAREPVAARRDRTQIEPLRLRGALTLLWLAGAVFAVAFLGQPWRELSMAALLGLSLWATPRALRRAKGFTTYPITEVAVLFFGIFLTMMPTLELLRLREGDLPQPRPWGLCLGASAALSL